MHLVSPVRVRIESGVTKPMTTTNFDVSFTFSIAIICSFIKL